MFLLLGSWLCICGAVTLRGSDRSETRSLSRAHQSIQNARRWAGSSYVYNSSQLSILIPEGRPIVTLPVVALQAHTHFPELRIQIMYGSANKDYVHTQNTLVELQQKGAVFLTPMPGEAYNISQLPDSKRVRAYSDTVFSPEFWQLTTTPKVLIAQTDSWICNGAHEHLKDFLQYDYVGAPWSQFRTHFCAKTQEGNGGFSLRGREVMLRITQAFHPNGLPEDAHFCNKLEKEFEGKGKLAPEKVALHFAREQLSEQELSGPTMPSVGIHNLWQLKPEDIRKFFEGQCPGVSFVNPRLEALDNSEGTRGEVLVQRWKHEVLPRMVALLQGGGSGILDTVSLKLMAKIFAENPLQDPLVVNFLRGAAETRQ